MGRDSGRGAAKQIEDVVLFDTNIWLRLLRNHLDDDKLLIFSDGLVTSSTEIVFPVVVRAELYSLIARNRWSEKRLLEAMHLISLRSSVVDDLGPFVDAYIEIDNFSLAPGQGRSSISMGKNDLWIAACASFLQVPLVTYDQDFTHLSPGFLSVIRLV
jgi:tRNA(fMet)-specific endonuclease VapC